MLLNKLSKIILFLSLICSVNLNSMENSENERTTYTREELLRIRNTMTPDRYLITHDGRIIRIIIEELYEKKPNE